MKTVTDFRRQITVNGDSRHEIKRCLLLGRKVVTNLGSELKDTDITLLTVVRIVKVMVFPVAMYRCESWTIKKTECQRTDAFDLWCWRRLSRVPWTARRSSQSILKKNQPWMFIERTDAEAEAPILWPPDAKSWLVREDPDAEKDWRQEGKRTTEDAMVGCITDWTDMSLSELWELVMDREACRPWGRKESDTTERPNDDEESGSFTLGCSRFLSFFRVETESCLRSKQVLVREKDPLLSRLPWCSGGDASTSSYAGLWQNTSLLFNNRFSKPCLHPPSLWRNRLARSAVNRKVGGSSPPRDERQQLLTFEIDLSVSHRKPNSISTVKVCKSPPSPRPIYYFFLFVLEIEV